MKDEFARIDRPEEIQDLINKAIDIDDRQYQRKIKRKGQGNLTFHKKKQPSKPYYGPQPMDLSTTTTKLHKKPFRPRARNARDALKTSSSRGDKKCFNYRQPGHFTKVFIYLKR